MVEIEANSGIVDDTSVSALLATDGTDTATAADDRISTKVATDASNPATAIGAAFTAQIAEGVDSAIDGRLLTFQGGWTPVTNTPALADGTGAVGDFYQVTAAGTRNLGSGAIAFGQGDYVQYDGAVWSKIPNPGLDAEDTGWLTPTLLNGYSDYGGGFAPARIRRTGPEQRVTLKGVIGGGTNGTPAFVLPPGFRPAEGQMFNTWSNLGVALVTITGDGNVVLTAGGAMTYVSVSLSFLAEQ